MDPPQGVILPTPPPLTPPQGIRHLNHWHPLLTHRSPQGSLPGTPLVTPQPTLIIPQGMPLQAPHHTIPLEMQLLPPPTPHTPLTLLCIPPVQCIPLPQDTLPVLGIPPLLVGQVIPQLPCIPLETPHLATPLQSLPIPPLSKDRRCQVTPLPTLGTPPHPPAHQGQDTPGLGESQAQEATLHNTMVATLLKEEY